jgi:vacuolar-type H+-ATPase subunit I/STV1
MFIQLSCLGAATLPAKTGGSIKPTIIAEDDLVEVRSISIYRDPVLVTYHFALYLVEEAASAVKVALSYTRTVAFIATAIVLYTIAYTVPNSLQPVSNLIIETQSYHYRVLIAVFLLTFFIDL